MVSRITAILVTGRLCTSVGVFALRLRTPASVWFQVHLEYSDNIHFPRIALLSAMVTILLTRTLRFSTCHFFRGTSAGNTSSSAPALPEGVDYPLHKHYSVSWVLCVVERTLRNF